MRIRIGIRSMLASFVLSVAMLQSCDFETSDNGDLDGFWHMESVDTLSTGGTLDLSQQRVFWAFSVKLMRLSDQNGQRADLYMRFKHEGDLLNVYEPYSNQGHEQETDGAYGGDIPLEDASLLAPYGIDGLQDQFTVERLNGSRMILKSEKLRLKFKKF